MPFQVSPNIEDPKAFLKAETTKCWIRVVAVCSQPIAQLCNKATSVILPAIKLPSQISPLCNDQTGIGQIMEMDTLCTLKKNQEPFLLRRNIKSNVDESSTFLWNPNPIDCQTQHLSHSESLPDLEVSQPYKMLPGTSTGQISWEHEWLINNTSHQSMALAWFKFPLMFWGRQTTLKIHPGFASVNCLNLFASSTTAGEHGWRWQTEQWELGGNLPVSHLKTMLWTFWNTPEKHLLRSKLSKLFWVEDLKTCSCFNSKVASWTCSGSSSTIEPSGCFEDF